MIYRKLDANGDYTFGQGGGNFFINDPAAVGQAVETVLKLFQGEWFLDVTAGVPYNTKILGAGTMATYDLAIQDAILNTQGVTGIVDYASSVNPKNRAVSISCKINTQYGQTIVNAVL